MRIHQCLNTNQSTQGEICIYSVEKTNKDFQLDCSVRGARKDVDLFWELHQFLPVSYVERPDKTFDLTTTIAINTNEVNDTFQLTCIAQGPSVNGTAEQTIYIYLTGKPDHSFCIVCVSGRSFAHFSPVN